MDGISVSNNPYVFWVAVVIAILTVVFSALNKWTTGFNSWRVSLRRVGSDLHSADLAAREAQIINLSADLGRERRARQEDRTYFEAQMDARDELVREHLKWDWKVYNVLVLAGLLDEKSKPPPLH